MKLTNEQMEFLKEQGISLGSVFDAGGVLSRREYRQEMQALGKVVAIGVTPCAREKHQLRTRSGHCAICNPDTLRFQERWWEEAFVYIAGSQSARVLKVGFASEVASRITSLNLLGYAGVGDWKALYWVKTENAGHKEHAAHVRLQDHACPRKYTKAGREVDCLETFGCNANAAISVVRSVANPLIEEWVNSRIIHRYQFESISGGRFVRKQGGAGTIRAQPIVRSPSRNRRSQKLEAVTRTENTEEVPAQRPVARKSHAALQNGGLGVGPSKPQFRGFTARCPECGKLNRISASCAHLKPLCGARECRASLVGVPKRP